MDRALLVPGAASSYVDEYVRDASGGFVVTTDEFCQHAEAA